MAYYADDMFHPANTQHDNDNDSYYSGSKTSDSRSLNKKQKKELDDLKSLDSGFRKVVGKDANNHKTTVEYYSTGYTPNLRIRCPVTGTRTNYRVGSKDEDLFYSVIMATGYNGQKTPDHLYYDSPEQYERHWGVKINAASKQKWYNRYVVAKLQSKL